MAPRKSRATMKEVAQKAGVSLKTVSNVVNDFRFVSDRTRAKVNQAIKELGYTVNTTARNLRSGQHGLITLAVPDIRMPSCTLGFQDPHDFNDPVSAYLSKVPHLGQI